jgi:hypothetical protein
MCLRLDPRRSVGLVGKVRRRVARSRRERHGYDTADAAGLHGRREPVRHRGCLYARSLLRAEEGAGGITLDLNKALAGRKRWLAVVITTAGRTGRWARARFARRLPGGRRGPQLRNRHLGVS